MQEKSVFLVISLHRPSNAALTSHSVQLLYCLFWPKGDKSQFPGLVLGLPANTFRALGTCPEFFSLKMSELDAAWENVHVNVSKTINVSV